MKIFGPFKKSNLKITKGEKIFLVFFSIISMAILIVLFKLNCDFCNCCDEAVKMLCGF